MTYRELWEQKNPDTDFDKHCIVSKHCPKDLNGKVIDCPNRRLPMNAAITCDTCWEHEIPEERSCIIRKQLYIGDEKVEHPDTDMCVTIKDSGDRTEFETGAVRDMREGKGRCDLMPLEVVSRFIGDDGYDLVLDCISEFQKDRDTAHLYSALSYFEERHWDNCYTAILEVAKHFEEGAKKYGENNWQKGIPPKCYIDSAVRHYLKWLRGDKDEPHDRAFVWNIMCCIWEVDYHENKEDAPCK